MKIELTKSEFDGLAQRRGFLAQKQFEIRICEEGLQHFFREILKKHGQEVGEDGQWILEGESLIFKPSNNDI